MHKFAQNCTYIEDNVDMTAREQEEMYREAYMKGFEEGQRKASQLSPSPRNVRDFFYSLGRGREFKE